ncbi:hypothetical protein BRADI_3g54242v3 [Brachypodium distachyon]|uniref:KIB1-4 beta-propeller domain-containing protein n=1 Tax=Brachypodium distachyon TaxID=15368 RepID=A0A0Q3ILK5_BRADI|nr:hypothetical protein BRADI_3g54242v3 [Brachypodium distachyon]
MSSSHLLPCLAFHHGADPATVLLDVPRKKRIAADMDELKNKHICPATHGYFLIRCPASISTFLWNPHNRTRSACRRCLEPYNTFLWYCRIGAGDGDDDEQWQKYDYDIGTQPLPDLQTHEKVVISPIAACGGRFYFNPLGSQLQVIDFSPAPVFSSITVEYADSEGPVFLVGSNDDDLYKVSLLRAMPARTILGASIHRMDFSTKRWIKVDDLGGRSFLLSLFYFGTLFSAAADYGLRENCVYIAYPWDKILHIVNVKDGSMESQLLDEAPADSDKAFWMPISKSLD